MPGDVQTLNRFFPIIQLSKENYARVRNLALYHVKLLIFVLYIKLNRYVMATIFLIPLSIIALIEASQEVKKRTWIENWLLGDEDIELDSAEIRNPEVDDPACRDMQISKVPFEELIKVFPNTQQVRSVNGLNFRPLTRFSRSKHLYLVRSIPSRSN